MIIWHGGRFETMSIVADEATATGGRVMSRPPVWFNPEVAWDDRHLTHMVAAICSALAGAAVEHRFTGERNDDGAMLDWQIVWDTAATVHYSEKAMGALVNWCQASVDETFENPMFWELHSALVAALLEHDELAYEDAYQLVRHVAPPANDS